jgi:hypothetical protein
MARSHEKRSSHRVSDEELEYYGNLYVGSAIRDGGVDFETFLSNPEYYLAKYPRRGEPKERADDGRGRKGLRYFLRFRSASRTPSG